VQSKLGYLIGLASALTLGCSGGDEASERDAASPTADGGGNSGGGGSSGANAGASDAATDAANTAGDGGKPDGGPSLFGDPPYERVKMPVRRLMVRDDDYCVILVDRTLHCGALSGLADKPPSETQNRDFVMVVDTGTKDGSALAMRSDGSVLAWYGSGSLPNLQLSGNGYIGMARWGNGATTATVCGLTAQGKLVCEGLEADEPALYEQTFVQLSGPSNGLTGLTPSGEVLNWGEGAWTPAGFPTPVRLVSLDHAHPDGRCGLDQEGALRCLGRDNVLYRKPRDYSPLLTQICVVTEAGGLSCRDPAGQVAPWEAEVDDVFVDVDAGSRTNVCAVNAEGQLKCFDTFSSGSPGTVVDLPKKAATSD
jgi:hypothetical protein